MLESNKKCTKVLFEDTDILLGCGDRTFESCHSDQNPSEITDFRGVSACRQSTHRESESTYYGYFVMVE